MIREEAHLLRCMVLKARRRAQVLELARRRQVARSDRVKVKIGARF